MGKKKARVISILIVDDHPIVRRGLKMIIEKEDDLRICAEAASASEAVKAIVDYNRL